MISMLQNAAKERMVTLLVRSRDDWKQRALANPRRSTAGETGQMTVELAVAFPVMIIVAVIATNALLFFSDLASGPRGWVGENRHRNGISWGQAFLVGIGQAFSVAPGLSRSGTTIATGLMTGVRRDVMAQFSFLMVLVPIIGEQFLDIVGSLSETGRFFSGAVSGLSLALGFLAAFLAGLFACRVMVALVRKARLSWFALYCVIVGVLVLIFA